MTPSIQRLREIEAELERTSAPPDFGKYGPNPTERELQQLSEARHQHLERQRVEAELQVHREQWADPRVLSRSLARQAPIIYAVGFLYSAEMIGKLITALNSNSMLHPDLRKLGGVKERFRRAFPTLHAVRDSVQHLDERAQWQAKGSALPDPSGSGQPAGGFLEINSLDHRPNGSIFRCTIWTGETAEIELSRATLAQLRDHIQACIDAVPWRGLPTVFPRD